MLTRESLDALDHYVSQRPFGCDRAFLFTMRENELIAYDPSGRAFLEAHKTALSSIAEPVEDVPGNFDVLEDTPEGVVYGVSCRLGDHLVVGIKQVQRDADGEVSCPFDAQYVKVLASSLNSMLPTLFSRPSLCETPDDQPYVCTEPAMYERFKKQWRAHYGRDKWLGIKGSRVCAVADTREELEAKLDAAGVAPPAMLVRPEDEEKPPVDMAGFECETGGFDGRGQQHPRRLWLKRIVRAVCGT